MKWKIIDSGTQTATANMLKDKELLCTAAVSGTPLIHLYDWSEPAATYGHFIDPSKFLDTVAAKQRGLTLAKRPTGGGIVFHTSDLAFSVVVPATSHHYSVNTLDNYRLINDCVIRAIQAFITSEPSLLPVDPLPSTPNARHFCMAKPTIYDVMIEGRKVGGAAQRRTRAAFLHQGTIALTLPSSDLLEDLILDPQVAKAMRANTYPLLTTSDDLTTARQKLRALLVDEIRTL